MYILSRVIHDWNDERATAILASCRRAMGHEARLLLVESVVLSGEVPPFEVAMCDINMLVITGGRERTEQEYSALLASAGFCRSRVIHTGTLMSLIEGASA